MDYASRTEVLYECSCGWRREYTDDPEWKAEHIQHPFWGKVRQYTAALLDVQWHNCATYHIARRRAPRQNEIPVDYEAAEKKAKSRAARENVGVARTKSASTQ